MTSSRSRTGSGGESGRSGTVSAARSESESQPSGRRSASTTQRVRDLGALELRADLGGRLADVGERRLPEVDVGDAQEREALERPVGADEVLDEAVRRRHQELGRGRVLGEHAALLQDRDPVAHLDRLVDVVGDEEDRLAQLGLEAQELVLQALAVDRVDGAERLVHQHHPGVGGQRAGDADALLLAARELGRVAVGRARGRGRSGRAARSTRAAIRALSQPSSRGTVAMFSAIVRCGKRPVCWIT